MSLLQKYLTIDGLYLCNYPPEDIYVLLIQVLSLPHTVDEAIQIFESMIPSQFEYYKSLDISRALALACQDVDTRVVAKMLTSKHVYNPNLSYYYPYLNESSLKILINHTKICLDEATFQHAFLGRNDLLLALLNYNFTQVGCRLEIAGLGSWESIAAMIQKYPITKTNLDSIVDIYGPEVLIKESK